MRFFKKKRKILWVIVCLLLIVFSIVLGCDIVVSRNAKDRIYDDIDRVPHRKVGLVLGTSPISTWTGRSNNYYRYRMEAAADLYNNGKVDRLIVSGGDYRAEGGYNEPMAMRDSLIKLGVDSACIILDYDGTRTLNSIAKVKDVYGYDSILIISQKYHNERALYQADYLGVNAIAYNAIRPASRRTHIRNACREYMARVKLFADIFRGVKPDIKETMQTSASIDNALLDFSDIPTRHADLLRLRPDLAKLSLDLVCGSIPDATNDSIVLAFAGAFTGTNWDAGHGNVASDHVSGGRRYKGYACKRNTGAFTWSEKSGPQFHYTDYSPALDKAAAEGGMGFAQEMMIHGGKAVKTTRPRSNKHQFRALCRDADGALAVYESRGTVTFGNFIDALLAAGVTEAIYTDMGPGWNYCFYRLQEGQPPSFLHNMPLAEASNFVVLRLK